MADLIFSLSAKQLRSTHGHHRWTASSGPHGKGALPTGAYRILRTHVTSYSTQIGIAYRDHTGAGYFLPIEPLFCSDPPRSSLGIHPDGNVPGTEGCIGIDGFESASFYDWIAAQSALADLILEVVP